MNDSAIRRAIDLCRKVEDTFDQWRDLGECFNELACEWVAQNLEAYLDGGDFRPGYTRRDLRWRIGDYLFSIVQSTGFARWKVNLALQYYALEQNAGWVSHLRSEGKARLLRSLGTWHWEGCKATKAKLHEIDVIHKAIAALGYEQATMGQIQKIVRGARTQKARVKHSDSIAKGAVNKLFDAIEGTLSHGPAHEGDLASWLDILLASSPKAADLIRAAFDRLESGRTRPISRVA